MSKTKRLLALFMALCMVAGLVTFIPVTSAKAAGETTVQSVEITGPKTLAVTFSDNVHIADGASYFTSIRFVDNMTGQNLAWSGDTPLQFSGDMAAVDGKIIFTLHDGHNLTLGQIFGRGKADPMFKNTVVTWSIEDSTGPVNDGFVNAILDSNNNPVKASMPREWADQLYVPIGEDIDGVTTLDSVTVTGDKTLSLNFSGPVTIKDNSPWTSLRLLNGMDVDKQDLIFDDNGVVNYGTGSPMQWGGTLSANPTDNTKLTFTVGADCALTIPQLYSWARNHYGNDMKLAFAREDGTGTIGDGLADSIVDENGNPVKATRTRTWADQLNVEIANVTVESVNIVSDRVVAVKFSDKIQFNDNGSFTALRIIDGMGETAQNLEWINGGVVSTVEAGDPLQFYGSVAADPNDATQLLFTLNGDQPTVRQLLYRVNNWYPGTVLAFGREEGYTTNGVIEGITGLNGEVCIATKTAGIDRLYAPVTDSGKTETAFEMTAASVEDDTHLLVRFKGCSSGIWNNGKIFCAIRLVDNMTNQNLQWDGSTPLQWGGYMAYVAGSTNTMLFTMVDSTLGLAAVSDILAYAEEKGLTAAFCFEEKYSDEEYGLYYGDGLINGYGEQAAPDWACNGNYLKATKADGNGLDGVYVPISDNENEYLEIKDVYVLGESGIAVEFDEDIMLNGNYDMILRLVDDNNNLQTAADDTFAGVGIGSGGYLQFGPYYGASTVTKYGGRANTIVGSFGSDYNTIKNYAEAHGLHIALNIGDNGSGIGGNFMVDNIEGVDSGNKLQAVQTNFGEGVYYTDAFVTDSVTVESIEVTSPSKLTITFSEEIDYPAAPTVEAWLRLADENNDIICANGDGTFSTERAINTGHMQWGGVLAPTSDKKVFTWTSGNLSAAQKIYDENKAALEAVGARFTLCFEQYPAGYGGVIPDFTAVNSLKALRTNGVIGNRSFNIVTGMENVRGITVKSAVATDNRTVKVTFSEPVVNNLYDTRGGFISIRLVDENDNLMFRDNKNGSLSVMEDHTCNQPVQFSGQFKPTGDGSVWEFTTDSADISYIMNSIKPGGIWEGYKFKFCIEQQLNDAGVNEPGFVDNFTSTDGKRRLEGVDYLWDRCYVPLSIAYSDPYFDVLHMESAKAINDSMALVQFSEPIEIVGGPFCAIRLVEEGSNYLGWTGEEGTSTPLQFPGYFDYADPNDHSKLYFIMNGGQLFGVKTIQDVIEMNGELEVYRDKFVPKLCIEKIGYPANSGVVENVIGEGNPKKVLEAYNTFYRLGYLDGAYCDITNDIVPQELKVESVTAINDLQLVVKFDNAIDLSKDNSPFMAVRLVDDDNNLLWDGEVGTSIPLQFTGDWDWYDEAHTSIIWTMHGGNTYGAGNVRELLNFEGDLEAFKDSNIAFCIEELPPNIYGNSGHIENIAIKGDSISHLLGNKAGGYDGCYAPITVDFDLDPLTYTVTAINDIQLYIRFNDSVSIINNPWMSIRFVDGANQLIWSDEVGKSTPMQFSGTWEWANDSHTAIIWTMNGANTCLANTITDVFDYVNGLVAYKGCGIKMCIEELATPDFAVHSFDDLVSNIVSTDGQRHLSANKRDGYDGSYKYISVDYDMSSRLEVVEIISNDEKTVDITFNKPAEFDENASLGLCYVDPDGKIGVGIDARDLKFKGTWEYTNDDHTAIKWTIKDTYGVTVKDLLGFMGNYRYYINDGYELKFYIEEGDGCHGWNCLVESVTTDEGKVHLLGTLYGDKDMYIVNLEAAYDYPVYQPEEAETTGGEPEKEVKYVTDYVPFWIGGGAAAAAGAAVGGILLGAGKKKKSIH